VLLVHAPAEEQAFMRAGHGRSHHPVMSNDFVIVGPAHDPARVADARDAGDALRRIAAARSVFVSRGDSSGTHRKELQLWPAAGGRPPDAGREWYLDVGQGMGDALRIANERGGYTLSDRATFLFLSSVLDIVVVFEGDAMLFNPYAVITVAGARNEPGADAFAAWLLGPEARSLIAGYGVERFGQPLFVPAT
jgi:tungstate transport system substrate-binding protein